MKIRNKNWYWRNFEISSNVFGDSNDENNCPHKLLLTKTQVSKLCKGFENSFSVNTKLSKTQLHKIGQSGRFLDRLLRPLLKTGLPLRKNVLKALTKSILKPLRLIVAAAASATDAAIHKKMFGSGTITLIISNEEMKDIKKVVKSLEESCLLIKGTSEQLKMKQKNKNEDLSVCY